MELRIDYNVRSARALLYEKQNKQSFLRKCLLNGAETLVLCFCMGWAS